MVLARVYLYAGSGVLMNRSSGVFFAVSAAKAAAPARISSATERLVIILEHGNRSEESGVRSQNARMWRPAAAMVAIACAAVAQERPVRVLVAYYSQTGNTEKLAAAIAKGAASVKGVEVAVRKTAEVKDQEMLQADGILVGTPVQWANAATGAKQFLDRLGDAFWKAKANGDGKTGGAFCTGGGVSLGQGMAR